MPRNEQCGAMPMQVGGEEGFPLGTQQEDEETLMTKNTRRSRGGAVDDERWTMK